MEQTTESRKIEAKKRGNALGFWFFKVSLRLFGLRGAYGLLYFVCLHYALFDRQAVSGAMAYIRRRFPGDGFLKRLLHVYRLFISQGKHIIDRFASISGLVKFDIQIHGYDDLTRLLQESDKGLVLLTAHVGNWQIAMTMLERLGKTCYLVMRPEDNQAVQESLCLDENKGALRVISPEQHLGGVVEIMNAIREGHLVSIMGDRRYGFDGVEVSFLGGNASFPYGAFMVAAELERPVVVLLTTKVSSHRYDVDVTNVLQPQYEKGKKKRDQLRTEVQQFASILEDYAIRHPYQCFFFQDMWKDE